MGMQYLVTKQALGYFPEPVYICVKPLYTGMIYRIPTADP